ncbi:hypothetical protein OROHE_002542 [Orobanche hederae]
MNDPKFEVGLVFESNTVLRSAIRIVTKKKTMMNTTSAITQAVSALKGTKRSRTGQHLDATTRSSKFSALTSEGGGVTGTQESVNIWGKEDVESAQK